MSKLLIGWAEESIVPEKKVSLAGHFFERISEYVEKPLTATALAIAAGEEQAVIVSADLLGVACNLVEAIRKNLEGNAAGLDQIKDENTESAIQVGIEAVKLLIQRDRERK